MKEIWEAISELWKTLSNRWKIRKAWRQAQQQAQKGFPWGTVRALWKAEEYTEKLGDIFDKERATQVLKMAGIKDNGLENNVFKAFLSFLKT